MEEKNLPEREISDNVLIAIRKIIQAIDLNSKKLVKQVGLTGPQLVILQEISRLGTVSVGEVAKNVSLSQGTVTGILERMEKRGVVVRQRSNQDKRRVMVRITESGNKILNNSPPIIQERFLGKFSQLEGWEKSMILSALQRLVFMMDAKTLVAEPYLSAIPIEETRKKTVAGTSSS
ncbi:MAG: MarR family transcriptional regulator [Desulfobacteraceae bacterium]|jgi:DNA-binding MarR family transcriptional regulator|nr:MarR family transcriptional regulator [Desulfobacteraceae bacterium]